MITVNPTRVTTNEPTLTPRYNAMNVDVDGEDRYVTVEEHNEIVLDDIPVLSDDDMLVINTAKMVANQFGATFTYCYPDGGDPEIGLYGLATLSPKVVWVAPNMIPAMQVWTAFHEVAHLAHREFAPEDFTFLAAAFWGGELTCEYVAGQVGHDFMTSFGYSHPAIERLHTVREANIARRLKEFGKDLEHEKRMITLVEGAIAHIIGIEPPART